MMGFRSTRREVIRVIRKDGHDETFKQMAVVANIVAWLIHKRAMEDPAGGSYSERVGHFAALVLDIEDRS
jgi:hypothetical protein